MDFKLVHKYTKDLTVLYVEDNEALRDSTYQVFSNFFKQIDIAVDGEDGLDKFNSYRAEHGVHYDLVISDINMPKKDGLSMAKDILEINDMQSVIFVTAHNEAEYLLDAIKMGITGFLIKPLRLAEFTVILYKVSKIICDRKLAEKHHKTIENMAFELEAKNQKLEKSLRILTTRVYKNNNDTNNDNYKELDQTYKTQILTLIDDDLSDLKEIHTKMEVELVDIFTNINDTSVVEGHLSYVVNYLNSYAYILDKYNFFSCVSDAMFDLARLLDDQGVPDSAEKREKLFLYMESYFHLLCRWQEDLELIDEKKLNNLNNAIVDEIHHVMGLCGAIEIV